jgi:hypothetical protein
MDYRTSLHATMTRDNQCPYDGSLFTIVVYLNLNQRDIKDVTKDELEKEGWPGMLISGYFMQLIDRPGWLIVATEERSGDESSFPMPL